jgi:hypothetical protein
MPRYGLCGRREPTAGFELIGSGEGGRSRPIGMLSSSVAATQPHRLKWMVYIPANWPFTVPAKALIMGIGSYH